MNPIILETMNDIINRVDAREWNRVNQHRFRMTDKFKKEKKKVETMKNDWEVATEKIGQENSDLHNEIKRLKKEMKDQKAERSYHIVTEVGKQTRKLIKENKCLKDEIKKLTDK